MHRLLDVKATAWKHPKPIITFEKKKADRSSAVSRL